jgi:glycosyltransferase involved in cell wall biosynthesis
MRKTGIVITVHNRLELTRQSFIDLDKSELPEDCVIIIIDDGSDDRTDILCERFNFSKEVVLIRHEEAAGVARSLREGWDIAIELGCEILVNIDNDVRLKPQWLKVLRDLHAQYPTAIITGFNSNNPEHKMMSVHHDHVVRRSCGGINMLFNVATYKTVVHAALNDNWWDWNVVKRARINGRRIICSKPSVVQHTGRNSNLNHAHFDEAEDF